MTVIMWIVVAVAALIVGWVLGWSLRGGDRTDDVLGRLASDLDAGRRPDPTSGPVGLGAVRSALDRQWQPRNEGREEALRQALGRIAAFLREGVRDPLRAALETGEPAYREAIETGLGAVRDLEFFLREPLTPDETHNLIPVVQQVAREFTQDWDIAVRMRHADLPVRAHIHHAQFMDAVYLLLHNAGQFGGEKTVDVTVAEEAGSAVVTIRDRGPGFSEEALRRAHDLFYTTTETGLGLGIPFARKIVESFGGSLELRNVEDGGAEVKLSLPGA